MNEQDGLIILASLVLSIFTVSLAQMQYSCMDRGIMKGCPESDGYIVMALAFLDFVCQLLLRALFIVPIFFFTGLASGVFYLCGMFLVAILVSLWLMKRAKPGDWKGWAEELKFWRHKAHWLSALMRVPATLAFVTVSDRVPDSAPPGLVADAFSLPGLVLFIDKVFWALISLAVIAARAPSDLRQLQNTLGGFIFFSMIPHGLLCLPYLFARLGCCGSKCNWLCGFGLDQQASSADVTLEREPRV